MPYLISFPFAIKVRDIRFADLGDLTSNVSHNCFAR